MNLLADICSGTDNWSRYRINCWRFRTKQWIILCLHEVKNQTLFEAIISKLKIQYHFVSLSEGFRLTQSGEIKRPLLTMTFDDGDKSVIELAFPVLRHFDVSAALFICTKFIETGIRETKFGQQAAVNWRDLEIWVEAGFELGSHTNGHVPLNQATADRAHWEILEPKNLLETRFDVSVRSFAYPWGYYTQELYDWLEGNDAFDIICTMDCWNNFPNFPGKHVHRKPQSFNENNARELSLYESIQRTHQRSVLNGLVPVILDAGPFSSHS